MAHVKTIVLYTALQKLHNSSQWMSKLI